MRSPNVTRRRAGWRAMTCALLGLGVALLLAAGCGGSSKPTAANSRAGDVNATKTGVAAPQATSAARSPVVSAVAGTPASPRANLVTATPGAPATPVTEPLGFVHRWLPLHFQAAVYTLDRSQPPADGKTVVAAEVEECVQDTMPAGVTKPAAPEDFTLALSDGTVVKPGGPAHDTPFTAKTLAAGQCERGWVTYELPPSATPAKIVLQTRVPAGKAVARLQAYWDASK